MFTADDVRRAVQAAFAPNDHERVLEALSKYVHYDKFAGPRVQLAILALAQLSPPEQMFAAIDEEVRMANLDPRDVLVAAEYPDKVGAPQSREEMRKAYRRLGIEHPPL